MDRHVILENKGIERRMKQSICNLTVPNDLNYLPVVLDYVVTLAKLAGFESREYLEIEIATEEAVTNVIKHAFSPGETSSFDIRCEIQATSMMVAVCDQGIPFDPSRVVEYNLGNDLDDMSTAGLGGYLMKNLVDQVEYINLGSAGKETRLVKYLPSQAITEQIELEINQPENKNQSQSLIIGELVARAMNSSEAVEVSRCFFDAYGYSYVYEDIYFPERIAALNQSGDLFSAVVVNDRGDVLCHGALLFAKHLPGIAEMAMAATRPQCQGQALAPKLQTTIFAEAFRRKLKGLYSNTVCAHPYSQRVVRKAGAKETCFLLAHSMASTSIKGIAEKMADRGSVLIYYVPLQMNAEISTIYPPIQHQAIILDLYKNLGIPVQFGDQISTDSLTGESEIELAINNRRQTAVLSFNRYGQDVFERLHDALYRIKKEKVQVVEAYLNLNDPQTQNMAAYLEKEKFLFTGFMPGVDGGDRLVMQYFNGIVVDYDMIRLDSDKARNLLDYIKKHDPMEVSR